MIRLTHMTEYLYKKMRRINGAFFMTCFYS